MASPAIRREVEISSPENPPRTISAVKRAVLVCIYRPSSRRYQATYLRSWTAHHRGTAAMADSLLNGSGDVVRAVSGGRWTSSQAGMGLDTTNSLAGASLFRPNLISALIGRGLRFDCALPNARRTSYIPPAKTYPLKEMLLRNESADRTLARLQWTSQV